MIGRVFQEAEAWWMVSISDYYCCSMRGKHWNQQSITLRESIYGWIINVTLEGNCGMFNCYGTEHQAMDELWSCIF